MGHARTRVVRKVSVVCFCVILCGILCCPIIFVILIVIKFILTITTTMKHSILLTIISKCKGTMQHKKHYYKFFQFIC